MGEAPAPAPSQPAAAPAVAPVPVAGALAVTPSTPPAPAPELIDPDGGVSDPWDSEPGVGPLAPAAVGDGDTGPAPAEGPSPRLAYLVGGGVLFACLSGWALWQVSPLLVALPVVCLLAVRIALAQRSKRARQTHEALLARLRERHLDENMLWSAPASWLAGPEDEPRDPYEGLVVLYPRGVAWFAGAEAAQAGAAWWKVPFEEIRLIHRTRQPRGSGLDVHYQDGAVRVLQVPGGGFTEGLSEALVNAEYPLLDN